jgi:hypothetical protein
MHSGGNPPGAFQFLAIENAKGDISVTDISS